jgi:large subunit ribosomal protein L10
MPSTEKIAKVKELTSRIERSQALLLTDFEGLTVMDAGELRRTLRAAGATFSVVKNTLMMLAVRDVGAADLEAVLHGPTAVAFVDGDVVAAAKSLSDAARRFPRLGFKAAFMDGRVLSAGEAQALATLEPRPVLLAKIAGLTKGEIARAASMFQALQARFVGVLKAYGDTLPAPEEAAAEPAAAPSGSAEHVDSAGIQDSQPTSGQDSQAGAGDEAEPATGEDAQPAADEEEEKE